MPVFSLTAPSLVLSSVALCDGKVILAVGNAKMGRTAASAIEAMLMNRMIVVVRL